MANESLIDRLKAATGPDRYADCHLWVIAKGGDARMVVCDSGMKDFVWERGIDGMWIRSVVNFRSVPKYTASIDAITDLIEAKGFTWLRKSETAMTVYRPLSEDQEERKEWAKHFDAAGATPPVALCLSFLKTLQTEIASPND